MAYVDYHSHGAQVRIAPGYQAATGPTGPACLADPLGNCTNPDVHLYHTVFGDPAAPYWYEPFSGNRMPMEHSWLFAARIGGNSQRFANFNTGARALALTIELPGDTFGFCMECARSREIDALIYQQKEMVQYAVQHVGALARWRPGRTPPVPFVFYPTGFIGREWQVDGFESEQGARPEWLAPVPPSYSPWRAQISPRPRAGVKSFCNPPLLEGTQAPEKISTPNHH